jgi:hypothetical protein
MHFYRFYRSLIKYDYQLDDVQLLSRVTIIRFRRSPIYRLLATEY